jgi:hypothetical protein
LSEKDTHISVERHGYGLNAFNGLRRGDIINGDGDLFTFKNEPRRANSVDFNHILNWISMAKSMAMVSLIYRPEIQGLPAFTPPTKSVILNVNKRKYSIPNIEELKELMRYGNPG